MSSRLTKKSLVSVSGCLVNTPCLDAAGIGVEHAQAADQNRHFRRRQRQQLRPVDQQLLGRIPAACRGDSCGSRRRPAPAERRSATSVCSCEASVRPGVKGTFTSLTGVLGRLLDGGAAAENDQVGERDLLAAGVELLLDRFELRQHLRQLGRLVDFPILLRARGECARRWRRRACRSRGRSRPKPRRSRPAARPTGRRRGSSPSAPRCPRRRSAG